MVASKGLALNVKIGAALDKTFKSSSFLAGKTIDNLAKKSKSLKDNQANIAKFKDIGSSLNNQQSKLKLAKKAFADLESQMRSTNKPTKSLTRQFDSAKRKVEQLENSVNKEKTALNSVGSALTKAGINTHNLNAEESRLAHEISSVEKTMRRKTKTLKFMSSGLKKAKYAAIGTAGAITALGAVGTKMVNSIGDHGDKVAKTADKLGLTTDKLQSLRYAAERSGVSTQTLDMSMQRMTRGVAEAANGTGAAKKTLEELGLSAQELNNMSPDKALDLIADKLKDVENASDRTRIAQKLFDSEGVALVNMLKDGSGALSDYEKQAHKVGYVLDEKTLRAAEKNRDAFLDMTTTFKAVSYQVGAKLMPIFTKGFKRISDWVIKNKDVISQWTTKIVSIGVKAIPIFFNALHSLGSALYTVGSVTNKVATFFGGWTPVLTVVTGLIGIKFVGSLMGLTQTFGIVSIAFKALTKLFLINPIGLAVTGIATAALLVYEYWKPIKGFFIDIFDWIGEKFSWFSEKISWMGDKIRGILEYFGFAKEESKKTEDEIQSNYHDNKDQFKSIADEKASVLAMRRQQSPMKQALDNKVIANQSIQNNNSAQTNQSKTINITNQITVSGGVSTSAMSQAVQQGTQKALAMYDTQGGY